MVDSKGRPVTKAPCIVTTVTGRYGGDLCPALTHFARLFEPPVSS